MPCTSVVISWEFWTCVWGSLLHNWFLQFRKAVCHLQLSVWAQPRCLQGTLLQLLQKVCLSLLDFILVMLCALPGSSRVKSMDACWEATVKSYIVRPWRLVVQPDWTYFKGFFFSYRLLSMNSFSGARVQKGCVPVPGRGKQLISSAPHICALPRQMASKFGACSCTLPTVWEHSLCETLFIPLAIFNESWL